MSSFVTSELRNLPTSEATRTPDASLPLAFAQSRQAGEAAAPETSAAEAGQARHSARQPRHPAAHPARQPAGAAKAAPLDLLQHDRVGLRHAAEELAEA